MSAIAHHLESSPHSTETTADNRDIQTEPPFEQSDGTKSPVDRTNHPNDIIYQPGNDTHNDATNDSTSELCNNGNRPNECNYSNDTNNEPYDSNQSHEGIAQPTDDLDQSKDTVPLRPFTAFKLRPVVSGVRKTDVFANISVPKTQSTSGVCF